jgi:hypothetical protein
MHQFAFLNTASSHSVIQSTAQPEHVSTNSAVFAHIAQLPGAQNVHIGADAATPKDGSTGTISQGRIEQTLADIWCQVLDLCQVDIHQNFFYLGGDALRSRQVHSMALQQGIHFSLMSFYTYPTIYELARTIISV